MSSSEKVQICWLNGSYHHRLEIIEKIKSSIDNCATCVYDKEFSADHIEMQIMSEDFFNGNKLIILKDIPHFKGTTDKSNKRWCDVFSNVPASCIVVVDNVETSSRQSIFNFFKKNGKVFNPPEFLKKNEAYSYTSDEFAKYGKEIEAELVRPIVDSIGISQSGVNVDKIILNVKKICSFVGKRKKNIEQQDVFKCLSQSSDYVIWDLFNAIDERSLLKCQKLMCKMYLDSSSVKGAVESALNMLLWRFRILVMLKEMSVNGIDNNEIVKKAKQLYKIKREKSGLYSTFTLDSDDSGCGKPVYTDFVINGALKGNFGKAATIDIFTRTELVKALKILEECMLKVRINNSETSSKLALDSFFYFICSHGDIEESEINCLRSICDD